jgi:hypothetical protein
VFIGHNRRCAISRDGARTLTGDVGAGLDPCAGGSWSGEPRQTVEMTLLFGRRTTKKRRESARFAIPPNRGCIRSSPLVGPADTVEVEHPSFPRLPRCGCFTRLSLPPLVVNPIVERRLRLPRLLRVLALSTPRPTSRDHICAASATIRGRRCQHW